MDERLSKLEQRWLHDTRANKGTGLLRHLALGRSSMAMTELARQTGSGGRLAAAHSPRGLGRRAYKQGDAMGAYNLAMDYFNSRDLQSYRHWLRRAAAAGDPDADEQLHRFETRLSHGAAYDIGRGRPARRDD